VDTTATPPAAEPAPQAPPAPPPVPVTPFVPVAANQRIEALDVVRGFALLGIFLMNIEWFSRPISDLGSGIPQGTTGIDWWANWFVNYFVAGKFWTIFSLLFGMGFAVMLVRAERSGRAGPAFVKIYLRRILGLAVFGAVHYIYLWQGDILFSYAVAAGALMIVLYGKPKPIIAAIVVLIGLGFIPEMNAFFGMAGGLAVYGLLALYLRSSKRVKLRGRAIPLFSFIVMLIGLALCIGAAVTWSLPDAVDPRWPLTIFGPLLLVVGWLSWKYYEPESKRAVRMAVTIFFFFGTVATSFGLVQRFTPDPAALAPAPTAAATAAAGAAASAPALPTPPVATASATAVAKKGDDKADGKADAKDKPKKTPAERAAEMRAEREKRLKEGREEQAREVKIFTAGKYAETVDWRARKFLQKAAGDAGFAVVLIGMFLLGMWFVRSGVMEHTERHLPFFRKLAFIGAPVGIGLGLLGSLIATGHVPGDRTDGWGIAHGLLMLGNLPACLGYVGMVVLMLHSKTFGGIRVLAPLGRMALTNYLMQSLIQTLFFYGYGLGHWGMSRSMQIVFVAVVYVAQIAFSHWWLARFRYGPMEWLWRGFTYRQVPPLRIGSTPAAAAA
jgi:uncharacterized membrane protein YeiB